MIIERDLFGLAVALAVTTALGLLFANDAASAPPRGPTTGSVVVRYGHLDFDRDADLRTLYRALRNAASRACGTYDNRDLPGRAAWRRCRDAAVDDAVARIGDERLAGLNGGGRRGRAHSRLAAGP